MAVVIFGDNATSALFFADLNSLASGSVTVQNSSQLRFQVGQSYLDLFGTGVTYSSAGTVTGGTVTGLTYVASGQLFVSISGLALPATTVQSYVLRGDETGLMNAAFGGNDRITGSLYGDVIEYNGGNDVINGRAGTDTVLLRSVSAGTVASVPQTDGSINLHTPRGTINLQDVEKVSYGFWTSESAVPAAFAAANYLASNTDVLRAFGNNPDAAAEHWVMHGRREGRSLTSFDATQYLAANSDLIAAYGTDTNAAMQHYLAYGYRESRRTTFDPAQYLAANADLVAAFGNNQAAAVNHRFNFGYRENRRTTFDAAAYEAANPDVAAVYGSNLAGAVQHYLNFGYREGRATGQAAGMAAADAAGFGGGW